MSQETRTAELREQSRQLCEGPLKHIRAAALAAALVPLASVAVAPASAQALCASGGVCGLVFNDLNHNGIRDAGEPGIPLVKVTVSDGTTTTTVETDVNGLYSLFEPFGISVTISALIPTGFTASPPNVGSNDAIDSDGVPNGAGYSVVSSVIVNGTANDFGFFRSTASNPGTGTPGYWKNHPEAWPVPTITVGGVVYTTAQAIYWLNNIGRDKTTTMFASLVAAMLNVAIGNDSSCVDTTIAAADAWMTTYGPVGANVDASSFAWSLGEPLQKTLDAYDNGLLCAPHRQ